MNEGPEGPRYPRKEIDPYADWTDDERMAEYAQTGDPVYLTPELARRMKVSPEVMEEVTGATENDLELAQIWQRELDAEMGEMKQDLYRRYGLDDESLDELRERNDEYVSYLDRLFEVASTPVNTEYRGEQDDGREIIEYSKKLLKEHAVTTEQGALDLVGMIRSREVAGVRDVQVIEEVFDEIHGEFVALSHMSDLSEEQRARGGQLAEVLNQFSYISDQTLNADQVYKDANYLADRYFYNFCLKQKFTEPATLDNDELLLANEMIGLERLADFNRDALISFEIEKGRLALFGVDGSVLYIADEEYSDEQRDTFEKLKRQISYSVKGQYFARRVVADVPYDLGVEANYFIDASGQLGRDEYTDIFSDSELLRDFLYLQKADMRETVEQDFGVELKSLSIKEQVFFLRHLQNTSMERVQLMQSFTTRYGLDGMRTFLSLEHAGEKFGHEIVNFAEKQPEEAEEVFHYYGQLLDRANQAAHVIQEAFGEEFGDQEEVHELVGKALMSEAQDVLTDAIRDGKVEHILNKIRLSSEKALGYGSMYVALRKAGHVERLEDVNIKETTYQGQETLEDDRVWGMITDFYRQRYDDEEALHHIAELRARLQQANTQVNVYTLGNNIPLATLLTQDTGEHVHVGAFNTSTDKQLQQLQIGQHVLQGPVEHLAQEGRTLEATTKLENALAYINLYNFIATEELPNEFGDEPRFQLLRNDGWNFVSKSWKKNQVLQMYRETHDEEGAPLVSEGEADQIVIRLPKKSTEVPDELTSGYVITKFVRDGDDLYYVLERFEASDEPETSSAHAQ